MSRDGKATFLTCLVIFVVGTLTALRFDDGAPFGVNRWLFGASLGGGAAIVCFVSLRRRGRADRQ